MLSKVAGVALGSLRKPLERGSPTGHTKMTGQLDMTTATIRSGHQKWLANKKHCSLESFSGLWLDPWQQFDSPISSK